MAEGTIAWFIQIVLLWIGIIVAGIFVANAITRFGWRVLVMLLAVTSIPAYVAFEISDFGRSIHEQSERGTYEREKRAFKSYCVGRNMKFLRQAEEGASSVAVAFSGKEEFAPPASFNAGQLADEFTNRTKTAPVLCSSSRLRYIEGRNIYLEGQYRFSLCPQTAVEGDIGTTSYYQPERIAAPTSTHELRFGPAFGQTRNPVFPERGFKKMQVQVVDLRSQEVLAEDTLFFLGPIFDGDQVCPNGAIQLHELLMKVFGQPSANAAAL